MTYPGIISVAGGIRAYAKNASMRGEKSYYEVIYYNFEQLAAEMGKELDQQDKQLIARLKAKISSVIDTEQRGIDEQRRKVEGILSDLGAFEKECRDDQSHFVTIKEQIDKECTGASGLIGDYEASIKTMNDKKNKLNDKYRKGQRGMR